MPEIFEGGIEAIVPVLTRAIDLMLEGVFQHSGLGVSCDLGSRVLNFQFMKSQKN
jgi:hypothetical protein